MVNMSLNEIKEEDIRKEDSEQKNFNDEELNLLRKDFGTLKKTPYFLLLIPLILLIAFAILIINESYKSNIFDGYIKNISTSVSYPTTYTPDPIVIDEDLIKAELVDDIERELAENNLTFNPRHEGEWTFTPIGSTIYTDYRTPMFTREGRIMFIVINYSYIAEDNSHKFNTFKYFLEGEDPSDNHN